MPRGRPKLRALEILEGNPSKRLIRAAGIEGLGAPFVPEHLNDDARGCVEVIRRSMPDKVYCALDSFLLAAFAMAWAVHKRAAQEIGKPDFEWVTANSQGTRVQSPWLKILNGQAQVLASLGNRLGLDPQSRANIALPGSKPASKFQGLIGNERTTLSTLSKN